jgi:hypothetical protein
MDLRVSDWGFKDAYFKLNYYNDTITYIRYRSYKTLEEKSTYSIEQVCIDNWVNVDAVKNDEKIEFISIQSGCCMPIVNKFTIEMDNDKNEWYLETKMFPMVKYYLKSVGYVAEKN